MDRVIAFNIPVDDMGRAILFYEDVFGWDIHKVPGSGGDYHRARTTPIDEEGIPLERGAINGGLLVRETHDVKETFLEILVDSIDETIKMVMSKDGRIASPKRKMTSESYFAIIQDSEGNHIGIWEDIV